MLNLLVGKGRVVGNTLLEQVELDGRELHRIDCDRPAGTQPPAQSETSSTRLRWAAKTRPSVMRDADLATTVPALLSGAFRSAGQKCTATSRIIVEQGIYDELTDTLKEAVASLHVGHALDPTSYPLARWRPRTSTKP